jgi:hypothetical protein
MENNTFLQKNENNTPAVRQQFKPGDVFMSIEAFEAAQRMVAPLAKSDLVPQSFQGKIGNCLIALEMAQRIGASPLAVMQNMYIVHGKPAWSSQFLVACINASGKFSPLRYKMTGKKGTDTYGCIAWAVDTSGEKLESPEVTIGMAKAEGWMTKNGSKWQTMPELMLRYRTATLFARLYAPELTMGIQTDDEIRDVIDVAPVVTEARPSRFEAPAEPAPVDDIQRLQDALDADGIPLTAEEVKEYMGDKFNVADAIENRKAIADRILMGGDNA